MNRYGIAQEEAKQGYMDEVNKANHLWGGFAESQPSSSSSSSAGLQWTCSQQGQGHSPEGTVRPQGPSDHPQRAGDVRMGEGQQAQGRVLRELSRWPLTCESSWAGCGRLTWQSSKEGKGKGAITWQSSKENCEGGRSQGLLREGTATSHLERGKFSPTTTI